MLELNQIGGVTSSLQRPGRPRDKRGVVACSLTLPVAGEYALEDSNTSRLPRGKHNISPRGGATGGASFDADLCRLVELWPELPEPTREEILRLAGIV